MIKVLHVTPGLESGGAEMLLYKLTASMDRARFENTVVSLTDEGPILGAKIREQSIAVRALGFSRGVPNPMLVWRLGDLIRREKPDVIQTWLYHGNAVGSLANALAGGRSLVWGLHKAKFDLRDFSPGTRAVILANTSMSRRFPTKIVCSSEAAMAAHAALGYPADKLLTIPNGIDTDEFRPNAKARADVRADLGLDLATPVVGMVARYTKEKDHPTFFQAAAILRSRMPDAQFLLCGSGMTRENPDVWKLTKDNGLESAVHLLGLTDRVADYTAALDVATCTSTSGESFCLALAEAMSSGVPCVTTDLEGPADLVGENGAIVPTRNPRAVAEAWAKMLGLDTTARVQIGESARRRIVERFSLMSMVRRYEQLYSEICEAEPNYVGDRSSCPGENTPID